MPRKIIIGYDGSENAEDALVLGRILAEVLGATPRIVAVDGTRAESVVAAAKERLSGFDVDARALFDHSPAHALHELAEAEEPLLIVLGSTHRGAVGRVLIGSVGEALLSGAPCAIAVAPRGYSSDPERRLLRIEVAVNGSTESWTALHAGISLAERLHAAFTVIAVAGPAGSASATMGTGAPQPDPGYERRGMVEVLDRVVDRVPTDLPVARRLLEGDPAGAIAEASEDFDLLIVGSRGYGPVRRTLLGGVSAKLMRSARCPVLVLPRGAGTDPLGLGEESTPTEATR